jgi:hypothetical protein
MTYLINNQARRSNQSVQNGIRLCGATGGGKSVSQLGHLYKVSFKPFLTALIAKSLC